MSDERRAAAGPLPIWFFVGLILGAYGLIILVAGLMGDVRPTVLAELRPALWWSAVMIAAGGILTFIGLWGHRRAKKGESP
jgi:hypothetical protein